MKKIILTNVWELIADEYLADEFDLMEEERESGDLEIFQNDPDYLKFDYYEVAYVKYDIGNVSYIIYNRYFENYIYPNEDIPDMDEFMYQDGVTKMLMNYYLNDEKNFQCTENTHSKWDEIYYGIKERGGSGYCYSINEYIGENLLYKLEEDELRKIVEEYVLNEQFYGELPEFEENIKEFLNKE